MRKKLLDSWSQRDLNAFRAALDEDVMPDYLYPELGYCSVLESIASTLSPESKEFAAALIARGASIDLINPTTGKAPLHAAVEVFNRPILEALLSANADVNVQDSTGSTVLHLLARKVPAKVDKAHEQCLDLVLSRPDLYLNHVNQKGLSPLLTAYEQGAWRVMLRLLKAGAFVENIDYEVDGKKSLREEIRERCPEILNDLPASDESNSALSPNMRADITQLLCLLESSSEDRFCYAFQIYIADIRQRDLLTTYSDILKLVQHVMRRGLAKPVKALVKFITTSDISDEKIRLMRSALYKACQVGNPKLLQIVLEEGPDLSPDESGQTALHVLAAVEEFTEDHASCWKLLVQKINVNLGDEAGRSALHLAARVEDSPAVEILLRSGAYIFQTDKTDTPAFKGISFDVLEKFLDSTIEKQKDTGEYYFDLQFLNPNREFVEKDEEKTSLLEGSASKSNPEMKQILLLAQSDSAKLLNHPIFRAFLAHKWRLLRPFYYAKLLISIIFCTCLTTYILYTTSTYNQSAVLSAFLRTLLILFIVIYTLTTVTCIPSPLFFSKPRQLFNFSLTVMATIVAAWWHYSPRSSWSRFYLFLSTTTIQLAALHLWLLVGSHPKLAVPFFLAKRLTLKCLQILGVYFIVFFAFALSFSILSRGCPYSECSSMFIGGITFYVPFLRAGGGHRVEETAQLSFILFTVTLLTVFMHLIGISKIVCQKTCKNSELYRLKAQVELFTEMEETLVEAPRMYHTLLTSRTPFKISTPKFFQKIANRILLFSNNDGRLRLQTGQDNIITTFQSGKTKSARWDEPAQLSSKTIAELGDIIKRRRVVQEKPTDQKQSEISTLMETTEKVLERMRQTSVAIERLDNKSREMENLLIQSLRINGLRDENL